MSRWWLLPILLLVAWLGLAMPAAAGPLSYGPDAQSDRGRERREAERERREAERAQREAERAFREAQREAERALREAQHEWRDVALYRWDGDRPWVERIVEVPVADQPVTVSVLLLPTTPTSFVPGLINTVQARVLPPLGQVIPAEVFPQMPLQFWQVQPNVFMLAHPALFWGPDDYWGAQQFATQLPVPGLQPIVMQGPLGYGTYLLFFLS